MTWLIAAVVTFVGFGCFGAYRFWTTAIILVHPWHLGGSREEARLKLRSIGAQVDEGRWFEKFVSRHEDYYVRLRSGIRRAFCRLIVLMEEDARCVESLRRVSELKRPLSIVVVVPTKDNRATPCEGNWESLIQSLRRAKIRRVYVMGAYLGLLNDALIAPDHEYYCVNDVVFRLSAANVFDVVQPIVHCCYRYEPKEAPRSLGSSQMTKERRRSSNGKKRKHG